MGHGCTVTGYGDAQWLVVTATRTAKRAFKTVFAGKQARYEPFQVDTVHRKNGVHGALRLDGAR